jgi:hypothetical protein
METCEIALNVVAYRDQALVLGGILDIEGFGQIAHRIGH